MSIDFDSAALQTQHEEEEYDQEDYAREQELQKLLTDLPDDMLEDSRDSSSPELEYSTCSNKNTGNSPQSSHPQQWSAHPRANSHQQDYEAEYDPRDEYSYEDAAALAGARRNQPGPHSWSQQPQDHRFTQGDYTYTSLGTEKSTETNGFSADEYDYKSYAQGSNNVLVYSREEDYRDHSNARNHFQELKSGPGDRAVDQFKARYNPPHPAHQPNMFNPQAAQQENQLDHLQREFLDSTQQTADREQLAQVQILNKAQQRQIEDLEQKLQDLKRNMRCVEHQFAIVRDEKDGLAVSLKESGRLVEEAKEREAQLLKRLKATEQQVKVLAEKDQENLKKQRLADAAVDSMKQQMLELCRSDTLSKAREQHDRDLSVMKEQHDAAVLTLQQKLDSTSQALSEQMDAGQRLREQVRQLERQREEEQLERARVINGLTQRLEESQQQCAKLLQTSSVQEATQMQIKLQQAQTAKALSENMNQALQEDLADLTEQITLYESAVKHGVITLDLSGDWENQLTDSCLDLGLKKINRKNGALHSPALAHLADSKVPKEDAVRLLRAEMQRCLSSLKAKRQRIGQLQDELQLCQGRASELQTQLDEAKLGSAVRESGQVKHVDLPAESQKELVRLQEDKQRLQEQVEALEKKNKELKQSEEKVKSANTELCTKMREMIQELDQEKQEASQRTERIHQQHRDDVVQRVRTELRQEHEAELQQLNTQHQQQAQELQTQLTEASDKVLAVQECYISVCKEKAELEERIHSLEEAEASLRETERNLRQESERAVEELRAELEAQHQVSVQELKALWAEEKEAELQLQLDSQVASAKAAWQEELHEMEQTWAQRLEEARRQNLRETAEATCQAEELLSCRSTITQEELEARLQRLQLEADRVRHKAVEDARKHTQRELHKKHVEDMAKQVEGAVTRAYNRWTEDLTSLPEYRASLQAARETWAQEHDERTEQKVSQALKEAEEQWLKRQKQQVEEQSSGAQRAEQLQEEVAALQTRLEQERSEQAALLKAELAAARAAWARDRQQETSSVQARSQQLLHTKLQEQRRALELEAQRARDEAELQKKELLLQTEARLQQSAEESRRQHGERERALREELLSELRRSLEQVQAQLLTDARADQQASEDIRRSSGATSVATITQIINTTCRDMVSRAVSQAKKEWKTVSEERLSHVLRETQQHHEREIDRIQSSVSQRTEAARCRKDCSDMVAKLQTKNQELQRHLEKACRQLQHSVRQHKAAVQRLREEHESSLQKTKEEHLQQLEEAKRAKEERSSEQRSLQQGLEEMKQQYLSTVEKIRGDMLRYLQESRERAAEMIRAEVQRERQDTARKMRRYYLSCLQELLQEGGQSAGAETKIMNAASKLAAMAKVLETPTKSRPGKNSGRAGSGPSTPPELPGLEEKSSAAPEQKHAPGARSKPLRLAEASTDPRGKPGAAAHTHLGPHTHSQQSTAPSLQAGPVRASTRTKSRDVFLQGVEAPVQPQKPSDWSVSSVSSGDSDTGFQPPRTSFPGRKVEPVKPFSISAAAGRDLGEEFGLLSPDVSDVTVYNEIAKKTPHSHREPTPGSEADRQQPGSCSARVFSELRQRQQDSGFHSPFYPQK